MPRGVPRDWSRIDPQLPGLMRRGFTDYEIAVRFALPLSTIHGRITKLGLGHLRVRRLGGPKRRPTPDNVSVAPPAPQSRRCAAVRVVSSGTTYAHDGRLTLPHGWGGSFGRGR